MSLIPQDIPQKTAYGDLAANESTPVIQASAQYGVLTDVNAIAGPSGTADGLGGAFSCTSGTNPNGFGAISTSDALIFRPGQGEKDLFSARFSAGLAGSEQFAGLVNTNAGIGFGYNGVDFGVLFRSGGAIEIQKLTITTPAGGSEDADITIDGTLYVVPLTSGTVQHNANEIAISLSFQVSLWFFEANDDVVTATAFIAAPVAGAFAFSSSTAIATWAQDAAGVLPNDTWIKQEDWNQDPKPNLIASNYNNYKIQVGPAVVFCSVFDEATHSYVLVHVFDFNNVNDFITVDNPTFGHTWYALNRGGTVSVTTEGAFAGMYREGPNTIVHPDSSIQQTLLSVGTTPVPIFSLRGRGDINQVIDLAKSIITGIQVTTDAPKIMIVSLVRNAVLTDPVWQYIEESTSILSVDTSATALSGGDGITVSGLTDIVFSDIDISVRRREIITIAVSVTAAPAADFTVTMSYVEDL